MATERSNATAAARLGRLEAEVDGIKGDIHGLRRAFEGFAQEMRSGSRPQWGTFIAGGSLIVVIITSLVVLGSRGPISTLADLKGEVVEQHKTDIESAFTRGQALAQVEILDAKVRELSVHVGGMRGNRFTLDDGRDLDARLDMEIKRVWTALESHQSDGHPESVRARVERLEVHVDRWLDCLAQDSTNRARNQHTPAAICPRCNQTHIYAAPQRLEPPPPPSPCAPNVPLPRNDRL